MSGSSRLPARGRASRLAANWPRAAPRSLADTQARCVPPLITGSSHPPATAAPRYGKKFDELSTNEQKSVGGVEGGAARGGHSADPERAPPEPEVKFGEENK